MARGFEVWMREPPAEGGVCHRRDAARERRLRFEHDQRRAAHAFNTARDEHVTLAAPDCLGGGIDRLQTGAAQTIDRLPGDIDRQPRQQQRHAGNVAVVLAGLIRAAENHIVDVPRIYLGAL
jgi:hypothetical protein